MQNSIFYIWSSIFHLKNQIVRKLIAQKNIQLRASQCMYTYNIPTPTCWIDRVQVCELLEDLNHRFFIVSNFDVQVSTPIVCKRTKPAGAWSAAQLVYPHISISVLASGCNNKMCKVLQTHISQRKCCAFINMTS